MRGSSVPGRNRASIAKETSRQYPCRTGGSFCYDISNLLSFISHLPWESIDSLPGDTCYICKKTGIIHDFFNFFRPVTKYPSIGVIAREGGIGAPVFRKNFQKFFRTRPSRHEKSFDFVFLSPPYIRKKSDFVLTFFRSKPKIL